MNDGEVRRTKSKGRKLEKNHAHRRSEEVGPRPALTSPNNARGGPETGQDSPESETKKQSRWSQRAGLRSKTSRKANGGPSSPGPPREQSNGTVAKPIDGDGKAQLVFESSKGSSEESQTSRSRSTSPSEKTGPSRQNSDETALQDGRPRPVQRSSSSPPPTPDGVAKVPQAVARPRRLSMRQSVLGRRGVRPLSSIFKSSTVGPDRSTEALPQLPVSLSTDKLPVLAQSTPIEKRPPLPRAMSSDSLRSLGGRVGQRKKDELWGAFRNLDGEFHK